MKINFLTGLIIGLLSLNSCFEVNSSAAAAVSMQQALTHVSIMPIAVIGSGPAGLMAAIYGARSGKPTYVIEGNDPGGLLMQTTDVENWPGEISIQGPHIIEKLRAQAEHQGVQFLHDAVERVDFSQWPYKLYTENGDELTALSIVIATGASPRRLGVPGENHYWGSGVTSCARCDASFFKNEEVVVVGGGDSAIEEAIQLTPYAKKITILVRKDHMRASAVMQERIKDYNTVSIRYNVEVAKIVGDGLKVTGVELYDSTTKQTAMFSTGGVFLAIGHDPNSGIFKNAISTDKAGYIIVKGRTQETSVVGVFAAGDVQDNRYRQAGSSAGDGTNAGIDAGQFLDDNGYTPKFAHKIKPRLFGDEEAAAAPTRIQPITLSDQEIIEITTKYQLDDFIAQAEDKTVIVSFWATECPVCKQMMPIFKIIAKEYADRAMFVTINVDEAPDVGASLFVEKVPCLLVFQEGALVARYSGAMSRKDLSLFVDKFISH